MINLEIPKKFHTLVNQSHQVATEVFRPNSRKYDREEHSYPKELDMLAAVIDGMNESGALGGAGAGSDSAAIRTTARLDGDEYVLNGEKIYVTSGDRAELIVVWATLDRSQGRPAIKSFVVERDNPGLKLDRLEHKLGIRASDTANFRLEDCRVPKGNLLGSPRSTPSGASPG